MKIVVRYKTVLFFFFFLTKQITNRISFVGRIDTPPHNIRMANKPVLQQIVSKVLKYDELKLHLSKKKTNLLKLINFIFTKFEFK